MSTIQYYKLAMKIPANLILLIGIAHLFLPTHGYNAETVVGWSEQTKDHFLYLATYMIAAFLLTLSLLTFLYARKTPSRPVAWFATISTILWVVRLFLEFFFPVNVPLFFVAQPHYILMAVIGLIAASYALASGIAWGHLLIKK